MAKRAMLNKFPPGFEDLPVRVPTKPARKVARIPRSQDEEKDEVVDVEDEELPPKHPVEEKLVKAVRRESALTSSKEAVKQIVVLVEPPFAMLLEHWDWLRASLKKVQATMVGQHSYWTPEHVRAAILTGRSELYLVFEEGVDGPAAFYVATAFQNPFTQLFDSMFIWVAYSEGGCLDVGLKHIERVAKARGLLYVEVMTSVDYLKSALEKRGWYEPLSILRFDIVKPEEV